MPQAGLFLAHFEPGQRIGIIRLRGTHHPLPMRRLHASRLRRMEAHPIADLTIGDGLTHDLDKLLGIDARFFSSQRPSNPLQKFSV